jgi:hypothetical protein
MLLGFGMVVEWATPSSKLGGATFFCCDRFFGTLSSSLTASQVRILDKRLPSVV